MCGESGNQAEQLGLPSQYRLQTAALNRAALLFGDRVNRSNLLKILAAACVAVPDHCEMIVALGQLGRMADVMCGMSAADLEETLSLLTGETKAHGA